MRVPRRREDIDTFEAGQRTAAVGNICRMDADVSSLHVNGFSVNNVLFGALENDKNLFAVVSMDREFGAGFLLDEAYQNFVTQNEFGFCLIGQGNVGNVL